MTSYERISLIAAFVAFLLSAYAVYVTVRLQRRQMKQMDRDEVERQTADVRVTLERDFTGARFVIRNAGQGAAFDVKFSLDVEQGKKSPLVVGDYTEKLPIPALRSGDQVDLVAALTMGTGTIFDAHWSWRNEDGTTTTQQNRVPLISP